MARENVERIVNVIPPAPTSTPVPGEPTDTPTATATSTPTSTSTPTGTPAPTNTPIPTATPAPRSIDVTACVDPSIMFGSTFGNDSPTLRGSTIPGAVCTGNVEYLDGTFPPTFDGSARVADDQGLVAFPWAESSSSGGGIARVQCTYGGGPIATACTGFLILQRSDSGLSNDEQQALLQSIQGLVQDPAVCNAYFGP